MLNVEYRGKYRFTLYGPDASKVTFLPKDIKPVSNQIWNHVKDRKDVKWLQDHRELVVVDKIQDSAPIEELDDGPELSPEEEFAALHWMKCRTIIQESTDVDYLSKLHTNESRPKIAKMLSDRIGVLLDDGSWSPGGESVLEED